MEFMILKWEPWIEIIFVKHVAVIIATVLGILLILIWHNLFIIPVMSHISIKSWDAFVVNAVFWELDQKNWEIKLEENQVQEQDLRWFLNIAKKSKNVS